MVLLHLQLDIKNPENELNKECNSCAVSLVASSSVFALNPVTNKNNLVVRGSDSDLLCNKQYHFPARVLSAVNNQDNAYLYNMTMHICCMYVTILT